MSRLLAIASLLVLLPGAPLSASEETDAIEFVRPRFQADPWVVELARAVDIPERGNLPLLPAPLPLTSHTQVIGPIGRPSQGALSGKTLFLLGGHGRTYDEEILIWLTQRSPMNGLVEDYNNQDQVSMMAEVAFRAGATIVPIRPLHHQINERISHIDSPGSALYGDWMGVRDSRTYRAAASAAVAAWTRVSRTETAVARFAPFFPADGHYPVYVWAPYGPDRARATYRIIHAGGADEVVVNHRMVGHGWVYLGRYWFQRGWGGAVELTNKAVDPTDVDLGRIVVADTVRFGNGRGQAVRPAGISNHTREDEASIYWMADSLGENADQRLHTLGPDRALTVGAPPRFSAHLNREQEGRFSDRVYLSFHSNASGSRGALGLWARDPGQRPDYQELLAEWIGRTVNVGLLEESLTGLPPWFRRTRHQLNHITFGELRRDLLQNEMSATILETAFFDQPDDARWLTDPRALTLFAQASLASLIQWFQHLERPGMPYLLPPPAPEEPTIISQPDGSLQIRFVPGRQGMIRGGSPAAYLAELSRDGMAFGPAQTLAGSSPTSISIPIDWSTTSPVYLRLRAINAAGTSLPSPVVASQRAGTAPRVLLVDASHTMDGTLNFPQTEVFGSAPENLRTVQRVRPLQLLDSHRTVRLSHALHQLGHPFDMASPGDLAAGRLDMTRYKAIIYDSGPALPDFQPMPSAVAASLNRYAARGGRVLAIGAWLAQALTLDGAEGARLLRTAFAAQTLASPVDSARGVVPVEGPRRLLPVENQESLVGPVFPAGTLVPTNAGREVIRWSATGSGAAAVAGPGGVIASVSPASLDQPADRRDLLAILISSAGVSR